MGLKPLEFTDCILDSPYFRENIHAHERELERTNNAIKELIKECKALLKASEQLSKYQRSFSQVLLEFRFECIGEVETDDEALIADALKEFGTMIATVEDERDRMLDHANDQLIKPLENFRKENILRAREEKRRFERQTEKYVNIVNSYLNMSTKKKDIQLQEADAQLQLERREFYQVALEYMLILQEVNEKKKFEFVETLLSFMYGQMTFYHNGHDVSSDYKDYMQELQLKLQNTRDRFLTTKEEAETLMHKVQLKAASGDFQIGGSHTRQGYIYVLKKAKGGLGMTTWQKHFCQYTKENKILTMIPYTQTQVKITGSTETLIVQSCTRRMTDSIDRRFCFDITAHDRPQPITLQAMNEEDRRMWLEAMDGKEPIYKDLNSMQSKDEIFTEVGFVFVEKCIKGVETRGIDDQGLYRIVGVGSKVQKLIKESIEKKKIEKIYFDDPECEWEVKTITSALKQYFRDLPIPLFTFHMHNHFLEAARQDSYEKRLQSVKELVHLLPEPNLKMLKMLLEHLTNVAAHSKKNLMAASNLGVVFGPTLMRAEEETMAAIMNLKYQSIIVEMLINDYYKIFDLPEPEPIPQPPESETEEKPSPRVVRRRQQVTSRFSNLRRRPTPPKSVSNPTYTKNVPPDRPDTPSSASDHADNEDQLQLSSASNADRDVEPYCIAVLDERDSSAPTKPSSKSYPAPQPPPKRDRPHPLMISRLDSDDEETSSIHSESSGSTNSSSGIFAQNFDSSTIREPSPVPPRAERVRPEKPEKAPKPFLPPQVSPRRPQSAAFQFWQDKSSSRSSLCGVGESDKVPAPRNLASSMTSLSSSLASSSASSSSGAGAGPPPLPAHPPPIPGERPPIIPKTTTRKVRTLYPCVAENASELSFDADCIITNVRESREPGWLEGTLDAKTGLIPANYVEPVT